jgi:hypothetical protein
MYVTIMHIIYTCYLPFDSTAMSTKGLWIPSKIVSMIPGPNSTDKAWIIRIKYWIKIRCKFLNANIDVITTEELN